MHLLKDICSFVLHVHVYLVYVLVHSFVTNTTNADLIAVTGHMVVAGIYNSLHLLPILYSLCLPLAPHLVVVLYLME